jgi:hypothetical protein
MNNSYATLDFEPGRNPATLGPQPTLVRDFLCRFDRIFTLNQDTLLERHYQNSSLRDGSTGRWLALHTPGLQELRTPGGGVKGTAAGMKLFIIDPEGVDAVDRPKSRNLHNFGSSPQSSFIGASRRDFLTTLSRDTVERSKVMRFFS